MKQQVKLYKLKGNPNNPRIIKNDKFKKLVKSIKKKFLTIVLIFSKKSKSPITTTYIKNNSRNL